ncbi:MAG: hypothetical protein WB036_25925 [Pseudolabrys sp.]|jgi:hypothetical protein
MAIAGGGFRSIAGQFPKSNSLPTGQKRANPQPLGSAYDLNDLIDQDHPILTHPTLLSLVKAVMSRKIPEFPVRDLSLLSASEAELYGTHSEIRRQAKSNNPSEDEHDVQHGSAYF